ncbi:hypothetical protein Taro_042038 [Colocasia esculenta]|uniref:Uncharacterized protein n=1 Tax=Colocasia esculenta TaxID=4460 RepID=A0A843WFV1_COLES|nr:hypothetical protein [Colocasia esculenta]
MAVHAAAFHGRRPEVLSVAARHVHGAGDGYEAEPPAPQVVSPRHAIASTAPPPPSPCQLPATEDYYLIRVPIAELQNGNHKKHCNKRLVGGGAEAWGRMSSAELRMSLHGGDQQTVAAAAGIQKSRHPLWTLLACCVCGCKWGWTLLLPMVDPALIDRAPMEPDMESRVLASCGD